jgi:glycerol-3-phosphate dehydrogenase (NAD(P)+)
VAMNTASVLGGGAFGTALAAVLASNFKRVNVWVRTSDQAYQIKQTRINKEYFPDYKLPENVFFTNDISESFLNTELALIAIPTPFLRSFLQSTRHSFPRGVPILSCSKGIERDSLCFAFDILREELPQDFHQFLGVISGPSFAKEILEMQPTGVVISTVDPRLSSLVQSQISSKEFHLRAYTSDDLMGIEVAGAVKNVLAIAAGAAAGQGYGMNTRAMLVCRGLAEMSRLARKLGSNGKCLPGLAGVGDLMLTCNSDLSRNFCVGFRLAKGESLNEICSNTHAIAEGIATSLALRDLSIKNEVDMPICDGVYNVLYLGLSITQVLQQLTDRPLTSE